MQITKERTIKTFEKLAEIYTFFKKLDIEKLKHPIKNAETLLKLIIKVKNIPLDPKLRPLINQIPKIYEYEEN